MRRVMLVVLLAMVFGVVASSQAGTINWGATQSGPDVLDRTGTPLVGQGPSDGSGFAGFVQLILDSNGDGPDAFVLGEAGTGDGLSDDVAADDVIATAWIGAGIAIPPPPFSWVDNAAGNGNFSASTAGVTPNPGDVYYIRVFDMPSPNYGGGWVPGTDAWYADITAGIGTPVTSGEASTGIVNRNVTAGPLPGDWQPVPEPGTLGLFALGMIALAARRRKC